MNQSAPRSQENFPAFFQKAKGMPPYPYQQRLALDSPTLPEVLTVPTGAGKTAAVTLAWLWRRRFAGDAIRDLTPRRLVWCLPMRVLVEQTRDNVVRWLHNLDVLGGAATFDAEGRLTSYDPFAGPDDPDHIRVHLLMGGDVDRDWDRYPERDAVLIGTQDQLLSRALNRGYAMSRFRWPVSFGLLHHDACWVFDEVQLMGNGLATSRQLEGFRRSMGLVAPTHALWMSATLDLEWMKTVDAPAVGVKASLGEDDRSAPSLYRRLTASKPLAQATEIDVANNGKDEAALLRRLHRPGSLTLMICNTVKRARSVFAALQPGIPGKKGKRDDAAAPEKSTSPTPELVLLHSRFRPADRARHLQRLLTPPGPGGTIAVCTQVVEAGVDVSAQMMVTELAPWSSLVQRFGRCNRAGEYTDAQIYWIDLPDEKQAAPYAKEELDQAREKLRTITDARPDTLPQPVAPPPWRHVVRRRDLVELFDTTPDLSGADLDVSRYIRESDDHDVQVFWRDFDAKQTPAESQPRREELCSVPVGDIKGLKEKLHAWRWDYQDKSWKSVAANDVFPGLVLLLPASVGGYSAEAGWTGDSSDKVLPLPAGDDAGEAHDDDLDVRRTGRWQTVAEHTDAVVASLESLLAALPSLPPDLHEALRLAARWHDVGKAHEVFQAAAAQKVTPPDTTSVWGKVPHEMARYQRRGFRHELASALAMLRVGLPDLAAYLAAAHHGKVRLSIRSMPFENADSKHRGVRFARGLRDGDRLPVCDLGGGVTAPETTLDLSYMELGEGPRGPSWTARMLALRDAPDLGIFRLAYLEALLRVADWRGSAADTEGKP